MARRQASALEYSCGCSNTGTRLGRSRAEIHQGTFDGGDGGEHVAIAHEAQVADAEHLSLEVILAASQEDVVAAFHGLAQGLGIKACWSHGGDGRAAVAITAVAPAGLDAEALRKAVKGRYDILLAGGQDHLKGKVFRIGHLGFVCDRDVLTAVAAIEGALIDLGAASAQPGAGVAAAVAVLQG